MISSSLISNIISLHFIRFRIWRNWFKSFTSENWFSFIFMLGLLFFFWVGGYYFFRYLAGFFLSIETVGTILIQRIMAFLFLALFMLTTFSDLITALSTLYLSKDLPSLHARPISPVSIFFDKFILTVYYGSWAVIVFGMPIFFAYGTALKAPWYFYPLVILSSIPFLIICAASAVLITQILAYFLPANRARTMIAALYGLSFVGIMFFIKMIQQTSGLTWNATMMSVEKILFNLTLTTNPYLPNYWINQVFIAAVNKNIPDLVFNLGLLYTTATLTIQLSCQLASVFYFPGWTKTCESVQGTISRKVFNYDQILFFPLRFFSPAVRSVIIKDFKIFWRDLTQWGQFTLLIALVGIYLYNTRSIINNGAADFMRQEVFGLPLKCLLGIFNLALVGFVLSNLAMRFVFTMISLEGRIIWVIRSSPFSLDKLFWTKFGLALITMLSVGTSLILLANHLLVVNSFLGWITFISVLMMAISLTAMATGFGGMFPTFNVENPMQLATGTGAIITVVAGLVYLLAAVVLTAQPMIAYYMNKGIITISNWKSFILPLVMLVLLNLFCSAAPVIVGLNRLKKRE